MVLRSRHCHQDFVYFFHLLKTGALVNPRALVPNTFKFYFATKRCILCELMSDVSPRFSGARCIVFL